MIEITQGTHDKLWYVIDPAKTYPNNIIDGPFEDYATAEERYIGELIAHHGREA